MWKSQDGFLELRKHPAAFDGSKLQLGCKIARSLKGVEELNTCRITLNIVVQGQML